jgi:hypothetical protein
MTRAPAPAAESPRDRLVIVGAGFGGLFSARAPRRAQLGDRLPPLLETPLFRIDALGDVLTGSVKGAGGSTQITLSGPLTLVP